MDDRYANYCSHYEQLRGFQTAQNGLFEELLNDFKNLQEEYQQAKLDHERETQFNRDFQREKLKLLGEIKDFRGQTERASFVLVLIDGDGMIFEDALVQRGEAGGKEAAGQLWTAVREHVRRNSPDLSSEYKIVARLYANLKGLGETCRKAGIVDDSSILEDFARGFTGSKQLFDFVDVGAGKDRADEKITSTLQLNLSNVHCRHILFGCSHDNGYARVFEDIAQEPNAGKISLLEGVPFERELAQWKATFGAIKFDNLFRDTKIHVYQQPYNQTYGAQTMPMPAGHFNRPSSDAQDQVPPGYAPAYAHNLARTPSSSTSNSVTAAPTSWASKAGAVPPPQPAVASPPPTPQPPTIARNKFGQRIDTIKPVSESEQKRVQRIKMCNVHFLRKDCPFGDGCTHEHLYRPTQNELDTLRYIARSTPCHYGPECDDIKCIYGHRCPHQSLGTKGCRYGDRCKFPKELHEVDLKVVRTIKV